jgi:LysR family transcriptional regulator, nitrogen assimilation regulatory protein
MDIKQLRAFLTVADTGNVTRAAELLNLVQPAVSRQLRLLEDDVGAELFERQRHGMVLTEAGRALVGYARRALLELDRARAEIRGSAGGVGGLVSLGLLPSTCDLLASPLVSALAATYPGIRARIAMAYGGTLQQWLETGEVDAALLYGSERSPAIHARPLIEEALWVVGPPSAGLHRSRPVPLASLAGQPLILPSAPHGIRTLVDHACAMSRLQLAIAAETNAMSVQKSLVLAGHGLTILPAIAVADDVERKQITAAPLTDPTITRTIVLALPANRVIRQHVRCAVDLLVQCIKDAAGRGAWLEARWLGS